MGETTGNQAARMLTPGDFEKTIGGGVLQGLHCYMTQTVGFNDARGVDFYVHPWELNKPNRKADLQTQPDYGVLWEAGNGTLFMQYMSRFYDQQATHAFTLAEASLTAESRAIVTYHDFRAERFRIIEATGATLLQTFKHPNSSIR